MNSNISRSRFIFIFLDGVGIGETVDSNPFVAAKSEFLPFFDTRCILPDKTPVKAIDACLGVEGMPMSATGQTSLFTGINVPRILNRHKDSYPDNLMKRIIKKNNILSLLKANDFKVRFLNTYPESSDYFTSDNVRIQDNGEIRFSDKFPRTMRSMISVTTCMMLTSNMTPYGVEDIKKERSLFHDFSNRSLREKGADLPEFSPEKAAEIIFDTSGRYDFTLYEFFQTDMYGHGCSFADCVTLIRELNRLLKHLISLLSKEQDTLLLTSDHGNLEDFNTRLHTTNPVPLISYGFKGEKLRERINSIADVTPAILELFKNNFF
jgi:bisphosphoglycerate-independent phosphoglycerate mutase (AlkP superfamily)